MYTVVIGGYYGAGNLGDEAILNCMLSDMRKNYKEIRFIVTSWDPEETSRLYQVNAIHWKDVPAIISAVQESDLVILGGGGLFQDYWGIDPNSYLRRHFAGITAYGSLPLLAKLAGIPCMIYAVGVGPLKTQQAKDHTIFAFENCTLATLRDNDSLNLLKQIEIDSKVVINKRMQVLADPVFSLKSSAQEVQEAEEIFRTKNFVGGRNVLGVVLRYWDFNGPCQEWVKNVADGINDFLENHKDYHILLIPFQQNPESEYTNDEAVIDMLVEMLKDPKRSHKIDKPRSPGFAQALLGRCSLILGMRLHSLIMGINTGIPVVGLPYDTKVSSLMTEGGLSKYCCPSMNINALELKNILEMALTESAVIRQLMKNCSQKSTVSSRKNAAMAMRLVKNGTKEPTTLLSSITLEQANTILDLDRRNEERLKETNRLRGQLQETEKSIQLKQSVIDDMNHKLNHLENLLRRERQNIEEFTRKEQISQEKIYELTVKNEAYEIKLNNLSEQNLSLSQQLNSIYLSKSWKLVSFYYSLTNKPVIKQLYHMYLKLAGSINEKNYDKQFENYLESSEVDQNKILAINKCLSSKPLKGLFILTSTFAFDQSLNQRVVNLAKFLSSHEWGVLFISWRWSKNDRNENDGKEVIPNVFQIPVDVFLSNIALFENSNFTQKYFVIEFPYPPFFDSAFNLKSFGFKILYEIIDDWEEFEKVGQSSWFDRSVEQATVLNADFLTAVSQPLKEKFKIIRQDISLIPNGYDPHLLGEKHRNISKSPQNDRHYDIGYFGHLTDSWFDWIFLNEVINLSKQRGMEIVFHIIGNGEPKFIHDSIQSSGNLKFYGQIKPNELYKYVKNWDLGMIPFKQGRLAQAVDPIKIYEYLYFGLSVVVTGIDHLKDLPSVKVVSNATEFLEAINTLRIEKLSSHNTKSINPLQKSIRPSIINERSLVDQLLFDSTWENRFEKLMQILETKQWIF